MPLQLKIHGLDCAEEVAILKREVGPVVGGESRLGFDILRARTTVDTSSGASADIVFKAVARTGMRAELWTDGRAAGAPDGFWMRHARTATTTTEPDSFSIGRLSPVIGA